MILLSTALFYFLNFSSPVSPDYPYALSHNEWNTMLQKHVSSGGDVDYQGFMSDRQQLESYISMLGKAVPNDQWNRNEQMAYWINCYNACTVKLILDHSPLKSILDIDNGKPWDEKFIRIGNQTLSLNDIEANMLRKKFNDPRIHFAINCASKSCPKLLNEAFTAESLEQQLTTAAKAFINDGSRNKISPGKAAVSKIFDWYKDDFTKDGNLTTFINQYSTVKLDPAATVSFLNYDWSLNQ